jgi:hypothetical protein
MTGAAINASSSAIAAFSPFIFQLPAISFTVQHFHFWLPVQGPLSRPSRQDGP